MDMDGFLLKRASHGRSLTRTFAPFPALAPFLPLAHGYHPSFHSGRASSMNGDGVGWGLKSSFSQITYYIGMPGIVPLDPTPSTVIA